MGSEPSADALHDRLDAWRDATCLIRPHYMFG